MLVFGLVEQGWMFIAAQVLASYGMHERLGFAEKKTWEKCWLAAATNIKSWLVGWAITFFSQIVLILATPFLLWLCK